MWNINFFNIIDSGANKVQWKVVLVMLNPQYLNTQFEKNI